MLVPELYRILWRYWVDLVGNKTGLIFSVFLSLLITTTVIYKMLAHGVEWWWAVFIPALYVSGWIDSYVYANLKEASCCDKT